MGQSESIEDLLHFWIQIREKLCTPLILRKIPLAKTDCRLKVIKISDVQI